MDVCKLIFMLLIVAIIMEVGDTQNTTKSKSGRSCTSCAYGVQTCTNASNELNIEFEDFISITIFYQRGEELTLCQQACSAAVECKRLVLIDNQVCWLLSNELNNTLGSCTDGENYSHYEQSFCYGEKRNIQKHA